MITHDDFIRAIYSSSSSLVLGLLPMRDGGAFRTTGEGIVNDPFWVISGRIVGGAYDGLTVAAMRRTVSILRERFFWTIAIDRVPDAHGPDIEAA